jgi:hypothetical protein
MLMVSLNEIQVTARKAVQGCGLVYGLAEEAAVAAQFLARSGLSVIPLLADLLEDVEGIQLNPLIVGPSLGDRLLLDPAGPITLRGVMAPDLLPGYLSVLSRPVRISWKGAAYSMDGGRICQRDTTPGHREPVDVVAEFIEPMPPSPEFGTAWDKAPTHGVAVEPEPWRRLQQFAAKILVPESEYSRLHGAGAGFIDRD